jgi:hypothetical protein
MKASKLFSAMICAAAIAGSGEAQPVSASSSLEDCAFKIASSGARVDRGSLILAQGTRRVPELRPQTGPVCRYEPVDTTKPAPGQCGFNDLGLPVHGTFRCSTVPRGNECVQRCEFVSCVGSNR